MAYSRRMATGVLAAAVILGQSLVGGLPCSRSAAAEQPVKTAERSRTEGDRAGWTVSESENFRIWSRLSQRETGKLAEHCWLLCRRLRSTWLNGKSGPDWNPKCEVVVHRTLAEYNLALGREQDRSVGCTTIRVQNGRVVLRRIDLRADAADWRSSALPHELAHVVLADRFAAHQLPHWVNEGVAVLAESEAKRADRLDALRRAEKSGLIFDTADLMLLNRQPALGYHDAFYGQSAALVEFLLSRGSPQQFLAFVEDALANNYDKALQTAYGIDGVDELARIAEQHTPSLAAQARRLRVELVQAGK